MERLRWVLLFAAVTLFPAGSVFAGVFADLSVTKTDSPDPVTAGNNLTYTITIANAVGASSGAFTNNLSDPMPANTTFVSITQNTGPAFACTTPAVGGTGTVSCDNGALAAGESAQFTLVVNVNASTPDGATITNTATGTTGSSDSNPGNNSATATTAVVAQADLSVSKADSPDPVTAGNNLTYIITLNNAGPSDAQAVQLSDPVPANTTFVSATQTAGPSFVLTTPAVGGTGTVSAAIATLAAGASATFQVVVNVNASTPNGATITNTATGSSTTTDPTPGNNAGTATTTVAAQADLGVTKTDTPDPVFAGSNITYTITLNNAGPSDAQAVQVLDAVPANTTFVSATQTAGPAFTLTTPPAGGTGNFTATAASFAAGASATFQLVVNVNAAASGTITNTATASSTTADPAAANNSATATTTVTPMTADLVVTKSGSPATVQPGANINYTITLTNAGPGPAQTVTLTDAVPAGTTFVSFAQTVGPAFACTTPAVGGTGTITCTIASLAASASATFQLVVKTNIGPGGTSVSNTATATSTTTDPNPGNSAASATTSVGAVAGIPLFDARALALLAAMVALLGVAAVRRHRA